MKLKNAFVLLQCDKKTHDDCRKIRDELLKYPNIQRAHTTRAKINDEQWCVAATAPGQYCRQRKNLKRNCGTSILIPRNLLEYQKFTL